MKCKKSSMEFVFSVTGIDLGAFFLVESCCFK